MDLGYAQFDFNTNPPTLLNFEDIFDFGRLLGKGGFGAVYLVRGLRSNIYYALKIIDPNSFTNETPAEIIDHEIGTLSQVSKFPNCSPDIVCYIDVFQFDFIFDNGKERSVYGILTEYIDGEDLEKIFWQNGPLNVEEAGVLLVWLLSTVNSLHELGIAHRDIKPSNIMRLTPKSDISANILSDGNAYKLIDFGISCLTNQDFIDASSGSTLMTQYYPKTNLKCKDEFIGTIGFLAPEVFDLPNTKLPTLSTNQWKKIDSYAIGTSIYYMLSGYFPHQVDNNNRPFGQYTSAPIITGNNQIVYLSDIDPCLDRTIAGLVDLNPNKRLFPLEALSILVECYSDSNGNNNYV